MVTSPALGILAAPTLASVAVRLNYGKASTFVSFTFAYKAFSRHSSPEQVKNGKRHDKIYGPLDKGVLNFA